VSIQQAVADVDDLLRRLHTAGLVTDHVRGRQ
jgi:hypothetical protein